MLLPIVAIGNHVRGHPMGLLIWEVTNENGIDCHNFKHTYTETDIHGGSYLMTPVIQCWTPANDFTYNGLTFEGGRTYNIWERD